MGGFPGGDAAGEFGDVGEAGALEKAGGDGRAIASGAVNEDGTSGEKFAEAFDEMIERDVDATGDAFLFAFARRADVE